MNKGLEILLARMESNPDEFETHGFTAGRWGTLIASYQKFLPEEDMKVFNAKLNERACNKFTEAVMEELLDPKVEKLSQLRGTGLGGQTQGAYSIQAQSHLTQQALHPQALSNMAQQQATTDAERYGNPSLLSSLGGFFK